MSNRLPPPFMGEPDYPHRPSADLSVSLLLRMLEGYGLNLDSVGRMISDPGQKLSKLDLMNEMIEWILGRYSIFDQPRYLKRLQLLHEAARSLYIQDDFQDRIRKELYRRESGQPAIVEYIRHDNYQAVEKLVNQIDNRTGRYARPTMHRI